MTTITKAEPVYFYDMAITVGQVLHASSTELAQEAQGKSLGALSLSAGRLWELADGSLLYELPSRAWVRFREN
jgi:hypothetical protein